MEAAHTVIWAMMPVIVIFLLGFLAAKTHDFNKEMATTLNTLVMKYALPFTLFVGTVQTSRSVILSDMPLLFSFIFVFGVMFFIVFRLSKILLRFDTSQASLFAVTAAVPGVPFIGPSVLQYMFGADGIIAVSLSSLVINMVAVPAAVVFLTIARDRDLHPAKLRRSGIGVGENISETSNENGDNDEKSLSETTEKKVEQPKKHIQKGNKTTQDSSSNISILWNQVLSALRMPVVWLPLLGFVLVLAGVKIPRLVDNSLSMLGVSTGGVSLFASGIVLALYPMKLNRFVFGSVAFKNIIQPLIIWGLLLWVGVTPSLLKEAVITTAMPTVSLSVMIAMRFDRGQADTATSALFSTLLSIVTMGLFVYALGV